VDGGSQRIWHHLSYSPNAVLDRQKKAKSRLKRLMRADPANAEGLPCGKNGSELAYNPARNEFVFAAGTTWTITGREHRFNPQARAQGIMESADRYPEVGTTGISKERSRQLRDPTELQPIIKAQDTDSDATAGNSDRRLDRCILHKAYRRGICKVIATYSDGDSAIQE
jgi:hypothetical protein